MALPSPIASRSTFRSGPYAPVSFARVLSPDASEASRLLLTLWFLSMMPMIFGGLMVLRAPAIPVAVAGVDVHLTLYFPVVLCTLFALWFGYWWGAIPAFVTHATVALAGGLGTQHALLLGVTDLLALGVLVVAYQSVPASTLLRSVGSVAFFVLVSFVAGLAASAAAFAWASARGLTPADTLTVWQGWWIGGLALHVCATAPLLFLLSGQVERWKRKALLYPSRSEIMTPGRVLAAYGLATGALIGYGLLVRYFGWAEVVTSEVPAGEVFSVLNGLSLLEWITFAFIGVAGFLGYLLARGWSRTASELATSNEILHELLDERELDQARLVEFAVEQEQARRGRDTFFSILSHDLRGPMGSLLGLSKVAENKLVNHEDDDLVELAGHMHRSSERLYSLLINLLEWSRLQTGQMQVNLTQVNLSNLVDGVTDLLEGSGAEKEITLKNLVSPDITVDADETMLRSIILNLVGNGLKFTNAGGRVTIRAAAEHGQLAISVEDTGIGICDGDLDRLFRIDDSYSRTGTSNEMGSGLGLVLCREMIRRQGGSITARSTEGKGSTFEVTLPWSDGAVSTSDLCVLEEAA